MPTVVAARLSHGLSDVETKGALADNTADSNVMAPSETFSSCASSVYRCKVMRL